LNNWVSGLFTLVVQTFFSQNLPTVCFMQRVTLKFRSAGLLWAYKQEIKVHEVEINLHKCTLTCRCSEAEISLAVQKFEAEIVTEATGN
jgi:hypothetical protein